MFDARMVFDMNMHQIFSTLKKFLQLTLKQLSLHPLEEHLEIIDLLPKSC